MAPCKDAQLTNLHSIWRKWVLRFLARRLVRRDLKLPALADSTLYPWFVNHMDTAFAQIYNNERGLMLPNLKSARAIAIYSDYGGEHAGSTHLTYSFLICDYHSAALFHKRQDAIRREYGLLEPHREIGFKDLDYGPMQRALPDFLDAANSIVGLIFTLAVDKRIVSLLGNDDVITHKEIRKVLFENKLPAWKPQVYEKNARIWHTMCYLLKLLAYKRQKLFWATDEDSIGANNSQQKAIPLLLKGFLDHYCGPNYFGRTSFAFITKTWRGSFHPEVLSLADLSAGGVSDYFRSTIERGVSSVSSNKAKVILSWLSQQTISLKKLVFVVDKVKRGMFNTYVLELGSKLGADERSGVGIKL